MVTQPPARGQAADAMRLRPYRIAFLRSIEIQQTAPYLGRLHDTFDADGVEARLYYTDGTCGPQDFPGEAVKLSPDVTAGQIVTHLLGWRADAVVSLSIADENALRDALVKEELVAHGIPMVMHSVSATRRLANKWDTKELVRSFGLDTPHGMLLDGDLLNGRSLAVPSYGELVERSARQFGFPLLTKPLWDCLANGVSFIDSVADLTAYLHAPYDGNVVLEKCLRGELCSVEVIGRAGQYVVQPLIWKGATGGKPEFTFGQLRYSAPRTDAETDFLPVAEALRTMCGEIGIEGAAEIEMIYAAGTYQIIEINPRVSGSTTLSIAASGCNTYACLTEMVRGTWSADRARTLEQSERRLAFQFPLAHTAPEAVSAMRSELDLVRATTLHIDGREHGNAIISCTLADAPGLAARMRALNARHALVPEDLIQQIDEVVRRALDGPDTAPAPLSAVL
ncbi:ATP-grasp domain-containing protein [Streptomyces angustmyceticus]|uniref:ATP-grasp domain-containing protein n=1 Tax=Streptomyces angustmyceticus TaxID=285578 RepID=UPI0037FF92EB